MSLLKNTGKLAGRTVYISGASRGIGRDIALKLAKDKANIIIAAKTAQPHPKLKGTIFTVAEEVEAAGGKAFPCVVDIRDEAQVKDSVAKGVEKFGGIDIVVNNASAISLTKTADTDMKRYDLMHQINSRGTFLVTKTCLPYLLKGKNPQILNLSPPLSLKPHWFGSNVAYTIAKYNMSMFALGWADELKSAGIGVNCLWPATAIFTAAMEMLGGQGVQTQCRRPEIMSDAAYAILSRPASSTTGNFFIDENVLRDEGITDMTPYAYDKDATLMPDFFLEGTNSVHMSQYMISGMSGGAAAPPASSAASEAPSSASSSSASGVEGSGPVIDTMKKIQALLSPDLVKGTNAIFQFEVKGLDEGTYFLDMKSGSGTIGKGPSPNKSDVTISVSGEDFLKLFEGKLSPTSAYMMGKMKIKGDMTKAMALDKLLGKLKKSKL